jgi:serine/threonine protein phosphatase PrpC
MRVGRNTCVTDTGKRRLRNEDAYVCSPPLFAVADGMGGAQAGELASRLAAAALEEHGAAQRGEQAAADLVQEANARIYRRAREDPAAAGMGSTVTVALVDGAEAAVFLAHVGDSRAYLLRGGALEQLTADHSLVAELVRSGRLTEQEAENHPQRSVITRVLGTDPDVDVDTLTVQAEPGDLFLLCSDGLTAMLRDDEILQILEEAEGDPERAPRALVDAANRAGGDDNVTVVAFELVEGEEPAVDTVAADVTAEDVAVGAAETTTAAVPSADDEDVTRHGAGKGGRLLALAAILLALATAVLLLWWGIAG